VPVVAAAAYAPIMVLLFPVICYDLICGLNGDLESPSALHYYFRVVECLVNDVTSVSTFRPIAILRKWQGSFQLLTNRRELYFAIFVYGWPARSLCVLVYGTTRMCEALTYMAMGFAFYLVASTVILVNRAFGSSPIQGPPWFRVYPNHLYDIWKWAHGNAEVLSEEETPPNVPEAVVKEELQNKAANYLSTQFNQF